MYMLFYKLKFKMVRDQKSPLVSPRHGSISSFLNFSREHLNSSFSRLSELN